MNTNIQHLWWLAGAFLLIGAGAGILTAMAIVRALRPADVPTPPPTPVVRPRVEDFPTVQFRRIEPVFRVTTMPDYDPDATAVITRIGGHR